jgi:uncharacterized iron-regulated membrane protein
MEGLRNGRPRQLTAWLDPATARVTDVAEPAASAFSVLHRLHGSLLIPQVGRKVVGWLGWAMTVSCVTGVVLWWPRSASPLVGLRWRRTPSAFDNLHHMLGFWIVLPLAVLSITGVYISFPQTSRALFGEASAQGGRNPAPRSRAAPAPLPAPSADVDAVARAAGLEAGSAAAITLPTQGRRPSWRVEMGSKAVEVSDADLSVRPARAAGRRGPAGLSQLMRQIHDGRETPMAWQVVIVLAGLAPSVLSVTGLVMWLRRRARRARLTKLQAA